MDKRELREQLGTTTHYGSTATQASQKSWLKGVVGTQPMQAQRMRKTSISSDDSGSPVGSPQSSSEVNFTQLERRNSKNAYMAFGFTN